MKKDGTVDLRIKRTQKAIKESFFHLVDQKGFEHISVKDITDGAMISRNTFYLHYSDKYDLLNRICDDLMRTLFLKVGKQLRRVQRTNFTAQGVSSIIMLGINAINDNKEQYRILFSGSSSDILNEKITDVIMLCLDLFNDDTQVLDNFSVQYISAGIVGLIKYYSANDVEDVDKKCLDFTKLHLGKIIDLANEMKAVNYEE